MGSLQINPGIPGYLHKAELTAHLNASGTQDATTGTPKKGHTARAQSMQTTHTHRTQQRPRPCTNTRLERCVFYSHSS